MDCTLEYAGVVHGDRNAGLFEMRTQILRLSTYQRGEMFPNLQNRPRPSEAAEIIVGVTELPARDREFEGAAERS